MKKWIAAALAAVLALTCIACARNAEQTDPTKQIDSTYSGVSVEVVYVETTEEDTVLHVQWKNDTEHPIMYGEGFSLQRWEQNDWVNCPMNENTAFFSIGYQLEAGKKITKPYALNWVFGQLPEGHYRFTTSCSVLLPGRKEECKLFAEFDIGCDASQEETIKGAYENPPKLMIGSVGEAVTGTYQWSCAMGDGTWSHVCADSSHPLQMEKHLQILSPGNSWVDLNFEVWPDDFTVRCWPDSAFGDTDANSEAVMIWNNSIELKMAGYIYEVTATWNDNGAGYYGTASYVFYAAPAVLYDVMPIAQEPTYLYIAGEAVALNAKQVQMVAKILSGISYDKDQICNCLPEYNLALSNGVTYGIHLEEGYIRCEKGQASLTQPPIEALSGMIDWALEKTKAR